jgi:dihydroxyacetone kinase-like protein
LFALEDDMIELGVGIHGEPGRERVPLGSATEMVTALVDAVADDLQVADGDRLALMVNGLGGTPISELYLAYGIAHRLLGERGAAIARNYVGEYCTSLDMAGLSVTAVRLDDEIADLLAAPAEIAIRVF